MPKEVQTKDLTQGPILPLLVRFFTPLFLSALMQQCFFIVDGLIVGRSAGKLAFAALDATGNYIRMPIIIYLGISAGAMILIGQAFGEGSKRQVNRLLHNLMILSLLAGSTIALCARPLALLGLRWMNIPDELAPHSMSYLTVMFIGALPLCLYNLGTSCLQTLGNSKRPLLYMLASSVLNLLLDLLFVAKLGWGAGGAAWATVISQWLAALLALRDLTCLPRAYNLRLRRLRLNQNALKKIFLISAPLVFYYFVSPFSNMFIQRGLNQTGADSIAAWAVVGKIDVVIWLLDNSLNVAMATFTAQNKGAGRIDRITAAIGQMTILTFLIFIPLSLLLYYFVEPLSALFISDPSVTALARLIMHKTMAPYYLIAALAAVMNGVIKGLGNTKAATAINLTCNGGFKLVWILLILPAAPSLLQVLAAMPLAWLFSLIGCLVFYLTVTRKELKKHPLKD